jgi:hypothetical protein
MGFSVILDRCLFRGKYAFWNDGSLTYNSLLQIEVGHGKKAIAIFVPVPLLQGFHKIQQRYAHTSPDEKNKNSQKNAYSGRPSELTYTFPA